MSEEPKTVSGSLSAAKFADGFRDMYYLISSTKDEFDVSKFRAYFGDEPHILEGSCVIVAPKDEKTGAYFIHFQWQKLTGAKLNFRVEYWKGSRAHEHEEREPFAEDFMAWLAQFFKSPAVESHLHARFRYRLSSRNSAFPLPRATTLPDGAELYGIVLRLTANRDGVTTVRLTQGKTDWLVEAVANHMLEFNGFEPFRDVDLLAATVSKFLEPS